MTRLSRMVDRLASCLLKWNRAAEHFKLLKDECGTFISTEPYGISEKVETEDDWHLARLTVKEHPDIRLGVIAGDVVNNLNASLDHLVYALSLTKPKGTGFPVSVDPDAYVMTSAKKKRSDRDRLLAGVPDDDRAIIDAYQPYESGGTGDLLWLMREFANADKHRVTPAAFANPRNLRVHPPPGCFATVQPVVDISWPLDDGAVIFRWRVECPDMAPQANVKVRAEVDLSIAFGSPKVDLTVIERMFFRTADIIRCF